MHMAVHTPCTYTPCMQSACRHVACRSELQPAVPPQLSTLAAFSNAASWLPTLHLLCGEKEALLMVCGPCALCTTQGRGHAGTATCHLPCIC